MKILITGGSGFLGSHIADELAKKGHKIIIFDKKKSKWIKKNQRNYMGDILNFKKLEKAIRDVKLVFHCAALADLDEAFHKPLETVVNNILGTVNVLELCKKYSIKRIIYASSIYATSAQGSFYRCSKKAAEDYIEEYYKRYGLGFTILRYGSLYGLRTNESNGVFRIIKRAAHSNKLEYTGGKNSVRKYIHVIDAAKATVDVISNKYKNKYVNVLGKKSYKVSDLFKIVSKSLKIKNKVKYSNKITTGHYTKHPKLFKLRTGINYKLKKSTNFKHGIKTLIKDIKNTKKKFRKNIILKT